MKLNIAKIKICSYFCELRTIKEIASWNNYINKDYTIDNEQLARFAKAMGHPARITIYNFWHRWIVVTSATFTMNYR